MAQDHRNKWHNYTEIPKQAPPVPLEKTFIDVLKAFTERDRKYIIHCSYSEDDKIEYIFCRAKDGKVEECYEFKKDLKNFTLIWNIYKVENRKPILTASYPLKYETFEDYRRRSLRANSIIIWD